MNRGICRSCGAEIGWVVSVASGKRMPIDVVPVPNGNIELVAGDGIVVVEPEPDVRRFVSHFVTCPQSADWRKKK